MLDPSLDPVIADMASPVDQERVDAEMKEYLLNATNYIISDAQAYQDEEVVEDREAARRYMDGETPDGLKNRPNRSTYVDTVVRDSLLWVLPNLSRVFHGSDRSCELRPTNPSKVVEHEASQQWLDKVLRVHNNDFVVDSQTIYNALTERTGWQRVKVEGDRLALYNIRPEYMIVPKDALPDRLSWPFIGLKTPTTPALLTSEGYDVPADIQGDEIDSQSGLKVLEEEDRTNLEDVDPAFREVWKYEIWWQDPTIGGWMYVVRVGDTILDVQNVEEHELLFFSGMLRPNRLDGYSLFDLVRKMQDLSTALHRSVNDYVYRLANPREEVSTSLCTRDTVSDLVNDTLDGRIRVKQPGAISPIQAAPLPGNTLDLLDRYDERVNMRTGIQRAAQGLNPDTLNKTASGQAMIMDASSIRIEQLARTLAETGYRDRTGLLLRMGARNPQVLASCTVVIGGQDMPMDPRLLLTEFEVLVNNGVGVGNRIERTQTMLDLRGMYSEIMMGAPMFAPGGPKALFTTANFYNVQAEILRLSGYNNVGAFMVDPMDPHAPRDPTDPPPPPSAEEQYVEVEKGKLELQRAQAELEAARNAFEDQLKQSKDEVDSMAKMAEAELASREGQATIREAQINARELALEQNMREKELALKALEMEYKYPEATGTIASLVGDFRTLLAEVGSLRSVVEALQAPPSDTDGVL
jgi:hypothetical protein